MLRASSVLVVSALIGCGSAPAPKVVRLTKPDPHPLATWPWPGSAPEQVRKGVTRWFAQSDDGTSVELFRFDFKANPRLAFKIYDQDEDDSSPGDNTVDYFPRSVGHVTSHLNEK